MGKPTRDLTGKVFGKLTVLRKAVNVSRKKGKTHWECRCECGNICVPNGQDLMRKGTRRTRSCGCGKIRDLTGQRFGRLFVLERLGYFPPKKASMYKVMCDCGTIKDVSSTSLLYGSTKSCGCYAREIRGYISIKHGGYAIQQKFRKSRKSCDVNDVIYVRWLHLKYAKIIQPKTEFADFYRFKDWALQQNFTTKTYARRLDVTQPLSRENSYLVVEDRSDTVNSYTAFGYTCTLSFWSDVSGIKAKTIWNRIHNEGHSTEDAVTRPLGRANYRQNKNNFYDKWKANKVAMEIVIRELINSLEMEFEEV